MLRIRFQRVGRKNEPHFRVVVLDGREGPKSGNVVETLGFVNPKTKEKKVDAEKAKIWLSKGAQATDTVYNLFVGEGIIDGKKRNALPRKSPVIKEEPKEEVKEEVKEEGEKKADGEGQSDEATPEPAESEKPTDEDAEINTDEKLDEGEEGKKESEEQPAKEK